MKTEFHKNNRQKLLESLEHGSLVVIAGYGEMQQQHDTAWPFVQEANFHYLTGIDYPEWWLIIDGITGRSSLVSPQVSDVKQIFDGSITFTDAKAVSGVDEVLTRDEAQRYLRVLSGRHSMVYTTQQPEYLRTHSDMQLHRTQRALKDILDRTFQSVQTCNKELARLRAIKQPDEVATIQKAIDITAKAFSTARAELSSLRYEYEIAAHMTASIMSQGSEHAYTPIIAGGVRACTLHYSANNQRLNKKEFVLLDVGARYDGYAADISRTFAYGTPTKRMVQVHQSVRTVQEQCVRILRSGLGFDEYQAHFEGVFKQELSSLKLDVDKWQEYCPHALGHGLGINVHDTLGDSSVFESGMVLTVEPGIYLPDEGIGVRIEDNILITDEGHKNLSSKIPVEP